MIIEKIELSQFRNYDHLSLSPHEGINIFFGKNGSGKTNLLEAIHYCALGRSHRITQDLNAVRLGQEGASCSVRVKGKLSRNDISVRLRKGEASVKSVWIDQKKAKRLSEMMGCLRCVIFSPEDLELIKEGPAVRRRFLDMMISQLSRPYFIALQQYRLAMEQRNAILRECRLSGSSIPAMIEDFERMMAENAEQILLQRIHYVALLEKEALDIYRKISGREEESFLMLYHGFLKNPEQPFESYLGILRDSREEDLRQGLSSCGPHRDDLMLSLNKKSMKQFASQGQIRTAALSMKLAQMRVLAAMGGDTPILLLDDVMSELDFQRRINLMKEIGSAQTFITCSDEGDFAEHPDHRTYFVYTDSGLARLEERSPGLAVSSPVLGEPDFS